MSQLNQMELQNLRHMLGAHDTACEKLQAYAQQASDQQIKSYFEKAAQSAKTTKQQLMNFLQ